MLVSKRTVFPITLLFPTLFLMLAACTNPEQTSADAGDVTDASSDTSRITDAASDSSRASDAAEANDTGGADAEVADSGQDNDQDSGHDTGEPECDPVDWQCCKTRGDEVLAKFAPTCVSGPRGSEPGWLCLEPDDGGSDAGNTGGGTMTGGGGISGGDGGRAITGPCDTADGGM